MESEEGKGTCITFYLPAATKEFNEPRSKLPPMKRVACPPVRLARVQPGSSAKDLFTLKGETKKSEKC